MVTVLGNFISVNSQRNKNNLFYVRSVAIDCI